MKLFIFVSEMDGIISALLVMMRTEVSILLELASDDDGTNCLAGV